MIMKAGAGLLPVTTRQLFQVPGPGPYFLAHSAGAMTVATSTAIEECYLRPWLEFGGDAWSVWLPLIEDFRASLATIIGGAAHEICPQLNVSAAFEHYLGALPKDPKRRTILMSDQSFPSLGYVAAKAAAMGYQLTLLPAGSDPGDPAVWAAAISDETAVVLAMHVYSVTGLVAPIAEITKLAHAAGARMVVDVAQSVGILPVAVRPWGVDAAVGSCLKWLSGGPGAGFLWVPERDFAVLEPSSVGWFSHEQPFEMNIRDFRYAPDALRFWGGTPHVAPFVAAKAGIDIVLSIGVNLIRAHNRALQNAFRAALEDQRTSWVWPEGEIGGTLCIVVGDDRAWIDERFAEQGVRADFRGPVLRLSFAAWNDIIEVKKVATLLAA